MKSDVRSRFIRKKQASFAVSAWINTSNYVIWITKLQSVDFTEEKAFFPSICYVVVSNRRLFSRV